MPALHDLVPPLVGWYRRNGRDLPWRAPGAGAWAVLVSEIMLQQTQVFRVLPAYAAWLERWPRPADLAAEPAGEAVRMWGRLGYPRRALRLHECARALVERHQGEVPEDVDALLALPGVGAYTARAVAAFAFGQRQPVVDTNVRRVVARAVGGRASAGPPSTSRDLASVEALLPADPAGAAEFSVALMELGALVCVARKPRCGGCPAAPGAPGCGLARPPMPDRPLPRSASRVPTGRCAACCWMSCAGRTAPVARRALDIVWNDPVQRDRALDALIVDGLIDPLPDGRFALPGHSEE